MKLGAMVGALLMLATPLVAMSAEPGFDAHGFKMVANDGDARDLLSVQRPGAMSGGEFYATGLFEYAKDPLVIEYVYPEGHVESDYTDRVLTDVVGLNLATGASVTSWLRFDLAAPLYIASTGPGGESQGVGVGDIRLGAMVAFLRPDRVNGGFGLGVVPFMDLPTGSAEDFLGQGALGGGAKLAATLEAGSFTLSGDLGAQFRPALEELDEYGRPALGNLSGSDSLLAGVGAGLLFTKNMGFNLEAHFAPALSKNVQPGTGSPSELIGTFRGRTNGGFHWMVGGASALSGGAGAATYRAFAGIGYGRIKAAGDRDFDGIIDKLDTCPDVPEVVNGFEDDDGCPDNLSQLFVMVEMSGAPYAGVDVAVVGAEGMQRVTSEVDPVPVEVIPGMYTVKARMPGYFGEAKVEVYTSEADVVVDIEPVTPAIVTVEVLDPDGNPVMGSGISFAGEGAPFDGVSLRETNTSELKLPPGSYSMFVKAKGYALHREDLTLAPGDSLHVQAILGGARVKVTKVAIEILEKVFFETDQAVIRSESLPLLEQVAAAIIVNPEVRLVEIAGHTDNQGSPDYNQELSEARANAVRDFLIRRGVEASRLLAKGYGENVPVDTNDTEDGRSRNRRVEFKILRRQ